jgi:hypothetical protein
MRVVTLLAILVTALVPLGCKSSDTVINIPPQTSELRYDADPVTAPFLPGATYEAAARFTAAQTAALAGGQLVEVRFYIYFVPLSASVKIYDGGTSSSPGTLLYSADISADVTQTAWASHTLATPVAITGGDLWIAIEFTHALSQRVIGCDPGPNVPNGDWLYSSADGMWVPFNQRFPISVNWNIRGIVEN